MKRRTQVLKAGKLTWIRRQIVIDVGKQGSVFVFALGPIMRQWVFGTSVTHVCLSTPSNYDVKLRSLGQDALRSLARLLCKAEVDDTEYDILFKDPVSKKILKG